MDVGELARRYPDHVKAKRTADTDVSRHETHVSLLPLDTAIPEFAGPDTPGAESSALPKARPLSPSEILNNLGW